MLGSIVKEAKELRLAGSLEKACAKAKIAVAHYPSDVNARMVLAEVLIDLGRPVDAVPHLQVVLSIDPLESRARQKLKLITGTHDYSLDVVETALAGTETRSGVYLRAAEYLNEGLLFADAARIAQAGLDRLTDEERATGLFGGLLFQLAFALEGMQDFDEAITVYDCVPVGQPIRRKAASHQARCLLELGRINEAETVLDAAGVRFGGAIPHDAVLLPLLYLKQEIGKAHLTYRYRATSQAIQEYFGTGLEPTAICIASGAYREKNVLLISEGGPGDEIRFAATYGRLASLFRSLSVTCDPRLVSLMERSFPEITFVPVRRHRNEILPASLHDRARVNDRRLISFINDRVIDAAANADLICSMLDTLGETRVARSDFRAGSRITPSAELKGIWRYKTAAESGSRMKVGLAWRSMLQSNSRNRHYLRVQELEALGEIQDVDFWVLQPNATDEELKTLSSFIRICVPSGLDLVDDFESQAALISNLDVVVSPLTTTAELAGMLGATTIILSRTHLTTWRANPDESDVWYESGRVVTGTPVWDVDTLVEKVASQIEAMRGSRMDPTRLSG
ncbi:tetratricopeptide repeat protein [Sinorhizobium saheli]|nr:tetratricopeptide repeat protein [Sinorhizobium saheli]